MEKLINILIGFGLLYGSYLLFLKHSDYASQEKRAKKKQQLKEAGLSSCYFFILPKRLLLFNLLSGGFFFFYWSYKQWQAVLSGYKNLAGTRLRFSPLVRGIFGLLSFYQLMAIVNRTCVYMRKPKALSHLFWGTVLWTGLLGVCLPFLPVWGRVMCGGLFLYTPYVAQTHINTLPQEIPPSKIRRAEIGVILLSWFFWGLFFLVFFKFSK